MSQYIRDRWGFEQGFPRGPVYSITQTPDGYLWIGTGAGLVRFDGLSFQLIKDEPIQIATVLGLSADKDNNLWVRLPGPTLLRYRQGVFDDAMARLGMPYSNVTAMSRTAQGELLIARLENGAILYRDGKFEVIADATPLARSPILSLARTPSGEVWMGTRDAGLFRLAGRQVSAVTQNLPDTKINCLLTDGERGLWVGTDSGVVRWNGTELVPSGIPQSLNRFQALAMARDRDGNVWVGTDSRGLLRLNASGVSFFEEGGGGEAVTAIFEDREANLWIGSASGLERIRDSAFVTYSSSENLPTDGNIPVFVDSGNRVWIPPAHGGLWWMKDGERGRVAVDGLDRDIIYSIASGGPGEIWLGRQRGGLTQLRERNGAFKAKTYTHAHGLAQDSVYSVYRARDGTVWAGTLSAGVSRLQNGKFTTFIKTDGLASNTIASLLESSDGAMWFATPDGLTALSEGRWRSYAVGAGLPSANVNCLLEDSRGVLWVGTAAGIAFGGAGGFRSSGLPPYLREPIFGIAEDRSGSLWVATSNRVLQVNRDKLIQGKLGEGDLREYGLADGLRGLEGVKRHRSVVADPAGRIWFSMNRGVSVVDPARLTTRSPAIVHLHSILADGAPVDLRGPVRIAGGHQRITLGYSGLSLSVPERVRFRYRLDGFDRTWSEPVSTREAVYTNLGPQEYRFRVVASNPDGVWNSSETQVDFEIEPLFWQAWWFRLSTALALGLGIVAIYSFRLRGVTKQLNVRFEERLAERTRIAQELHDTLLQGFLSASMQLHVAADKIADDAPAKPTVNRVLQLMGQVIDEGRNAVRGLRSAPSGALDLEQAFSQVQRELAMHDDIDFRVITEGQPRRLHPVLRDEVYRIGREALVNAFRHASATSIEVEIAYSAKIFRMLVRDNGRGIDAGVLKSGREGHWGLRGMRERAESIGGQFHVWSGAAAGTEVELSVPANVAFQMDSSETLWARFAAWRKNGRRNQ